MTIFRVAFLFIGFIFLSNCSSIGTAPEASIEMSGNDLYSKAIQSKRKQFEDCGRDSVSIQTGSAQKIKLKFQIDENGKAIRTDILEMTDPDPDLRYCVLKILRTINFPKSKKDEKKEILYPFTIKPS